MRAKKYSVYDAKTDRPVAIYQSSKECAKVMGITLNLGGKDYEKDSYFI